MKKNKNKTGIIIFSVFCCLVIIGLFNTWKNEISLNINKKVTIGRVTDFKYRRKTRGYIEYEFYANGKLFEARDPSKSGWPKLIRESKAERFKFYPVEYDITDPNNSKIRITENPLEIGTLLRNGIKIKGKVENIYVVSDSYVDLHISYKYLEGNFKFRTRQHLDSLPCGDIDNCQHNEIELIISRDFPDINNLYYLSYDRIAMEKAKEKK